MADSEKNIGVSVDDKDLDEVSGGVVSPQDIEQKIIDWAREELKPKNPVVVPKSPHITLKND